MRTLYISHDVDLLQSPSSRRKKELSKKKCSFFLFSFFFFFFLLLLLVSMVKDVFQRAMTRMREGKRELEPSYMLKCEGLHAEDAWAIAEELKVNASLTDLDLG